MNALQRTESDTIQPILTGMLQAYNHMLGVVRENEDLGSQRLGSRGRWAGTIPRPYHSAKRSHRMIRDGLDSGHRTLATTGLLSLISDCHTVRQTQNGLVLQKLQPYLDALGELIQRASVVLGVECVLPGVDDYDGPASRTDSFSKGARDQRQRSVVLERLERRAEADGDARSAVVRMLRDPQSSLGGTLTAAEHALLSTVVPESALLPDVAAMHDFYHPNVALYDTEHDRNWNWNGGVHLGFYVSTMLHEFVVHRGCMRRFTFVHLLYRMGFAVADINFFATYVEDTFYRRVVCDSLPGTVLLAVPCPFAVRFPGGELQSPDSLVSGTGVGQPVGLFHGQSASRGRRTVASHDPRRHDRGRRREGTRRM